MIYSNTPKKLIRKIQKSYSLKFKSKFLIKHYDYTYKYYLSPKTILNININDIFGWCREEDYHKHTFPGIIMDGDWKIKNKTIEGRPIHTGLYQRFILKKNWEDTDLFISYKKSLENGNSVRGIKSFDKLIQYYQKYDRIYKEIKAEGIIHPSASKRNIDPIYVHIYRNGEILWTSNANHRLSICYLLGINVIPVNVFIRHKEWQQKKEKILGKLFSGKDLKDDFKYITHPSIRAHLNYFDK